MVSISACHAEDPGSIPGGGGLVLRVDIRHAPHPGPVPHHEPPTITHEQQVFNMTLGRNRQCYAIHAWLSLDDSGDTAFHPPGGQQSPVVDAPRKHYPQAPIKAYRSPPTARRARHRPEARAPPRNIYLASRFRVPLARVGEGGMRMHEVTATHHLVPWCNG